MATTFVAHADDSSSYASSVIVSKPTGTTEDDLMVAIVSRSSSDTSAPSSTPSGWILIGEVTSATNNLGYVGAWYKLAGSSEPSSYTWSFSASGKIRGDISSYRGGFDTSDIVDISGTRAYSVNSTLFPSVTGLTTSDDGSSAIFLGVQFKTSSCTVTPPSGYSEDVDTGNTSADLWVFYCNGEEDSGTYFASASTQTNNAKFTASLVLTPGIESYEADLGTGALSLSDNSITAGVSRDSATAGTGSLALSGGGVDATLTVAADAELETGALGLTGGNTTAVVDRVADLGTGIITLGAGEPRIADDFEADLGTGVMVLGATRIKEPEDIETGALTLGADPLVTAGLSYLDYNQERWFALAGERIRGCVFADNYISEYRTRRTGGTVAGSPTYTSSVVLDGFQYIVYNEQALTNTFSAVVKFSAESASSGVLFGTTSPLSVDGWRIQVDATGIRANHSDGTSIGTECSVDCDYADGEVHTVTYVVDMVSGDHTLYVDADSDTQSTSATGTIGAGREIVVGGIGFAGTIQSARLFEGELTAQEHLVYLNDNLPSLLSDSIATYRCDAVCDQTNHIWSQTLNLNDLTKGDGVSAGYPTQTDEHYVFDGVDDYVSGWPTRPTTYTDSAALETTGYPYIQQVNDDTVKTSLTTSGSFTGNLYNLVLCTGSLTELEKNHLEYLQLKRTERGYATDIENALIVDGTCVLNHYYDETDTTDDYSKTNATAVETDTTWNNGLTFPLPTSLVTVTDEAALRLDKLTLAISGQGLDDTSGTEYLVYKNGNYYLTVSPIDASTFQADFNGSTATLDSNSVTHISVTAVDGAKPRFHVNGEYITEGSSTVTLNSATTNNLIIGNDSGSNQFAGTLERVHVYNAPLTNTEIKHLYNQSLKAFP
jgi:hypothetical protein